MKAKISFTVAVGIALLAFAAPANAAHVACGATLTTDTFLDGDIVCASTDSTGLTIGADNVTLWMNGYALRGSAANTNDIGITSSLNGVTIRGGGTIEGFVFSVYLAGSDSAVLRTTITSTECSTGGFAAILITADRAYAYRNVVDAPICPAGNSGILFSNANDSEAWGNTVRGTSFSGIAIAGDRPRAILNTVENCSGTGVSVGGYLTGAWASRNTVGGSRSVSLGVPATQTATVQAATVGSVTTW